MKSNGMEQSEIDEVPRVVYSDAGKRKRKQQKIR